MRKNLGLSLLGVWLVVTALLGLFHLVMPYAGLVLNVLALVAGIFILAGK
jgi:hypothetical protein